MTCNRTNCSTDFLLPPFFTVNSEAAAHQGQDEAHLPPLAFPTSSTAIIIITIAIMRLKKLIIENTDEEKEERSGEKR